eukprot:3677628-Rhodomonas_salina.2
MKPRAYFRLSAMDVGNAGQMWSRCLALWADSLSNSALFWMPGARQVGAHALPEAKRKRNL